jgi:hypothetical protein
LQDALSIATDVQDILRVCFIHIANKAVLLYSADGTFEVPANIGVAGLSLTALHSTLAIFAEVHLFVENS